MRHRLIAAVPLLLLLQGSRVTYLIDYPHLVREGHPSGDLMGKGELTLWTKGDSAFGTFTLTEPQRRAADTLSGVSRGDTLLLVSKPRSGTLGGNGGGSTTAQTWWTLVRSGDSVRGSFTTSFGGGPLPDVTRGVAGKRTSPH